MVPRGETTCPVCKKGFKSHHRVKVHMGVHRGGKFPCGKCGRCWPQNVTGMSTHNRVCMVRGLNAQYVRNCSQVLRPCTSITRPNMGRIRLYPQGGLSVLIVQRPSKSKRLGLSTNRIVLITLTKRVHIFAGL